VVVEHDMSFIDTISEKVTVLAQGAILQKAHWQRYKPMKM
jgi:ABC-type uncharacterized transport system ATPase subunit